MNIETSSPLCPELRDGAVCPPDHASYPLITRKRRRTLDHYLDQIVPRYHLKLNPIRDPLDHPLLAVDLETINDARYPVKPDGIASGAIAYLADVE